MLAGLELPHANVPSLCVLVTLLKHISNGGHLSLQSPEGVIPMDPTIEKLSQPS